jgi:hypothetical protein
MPDPDSTDDGAPGMARPPPVTDGSTFTGPGPTPGGGARVTTGPGGSAAGNAGGAGAAGAAGVEDVTGTMGAAGDGDGELYPVAGLVTCR